MSTQPGRPSIWFPLTAATSLFGSTSANGTMVAHYVLTGSRIPEWITIFALLFFVSALVASILGLMMTLSFGLSGHQRIRWKRWVMSAKASRATTLGCYLLPWLTLAGIFFLATRWLH